VTVDGIGNVYVADFGNFRLRRIGLDGIITTVAGNGTFGSSGDGAPQSTPNYPIQPALPLIHRAICSSPNRIFLAIFLPVRTASAKYPWMV